MALDILIIDPHGGKFFASSLMDALDADFEIQIEVPKNHEDALEELRKRGGSYNVIVLEHDQRELKRTEMLAAISEHAPEARRVGFSVNWTEQNAREAGLAMYNKNSGPIITYLLELAREKV